MAGKTRPKKPVFPEKNSPRILTAEQILKNKPKTSWGVREKLENPLKTAPP
jgi:hypothetical protein